MPRLSRTSAPKPALRRSLAAAAAAAGAATDAALLVLVPVMRRLRCCCWCGCWHCCYGRVVVKPAAHKKLLLRGVHRLEAVLLAGGVRSQGHIPVIPRWSELRSELRRAKL
jgi:hypothetical protein